MWRFSLGGKVLGGEMVSGVRGNALTCADARRCAWKVH